ncbi:hypothetical protein ACP70R_032395 [Stipagrostis hirtigluma subsp. patula]
MAEESRRRRRRRRRSTSEITRNCSRAGGTRAYAPTSIHDIADDLLELVLLRIGSPSCIVRAAATCKLWRRVIADAGFLRRRGSLHALRGHYHVRQRCGRSFTFVPSPELPREAAVDLWNHVDVYLFFLPLRIRLDGNLVLNDSRGGLLAFVLRCSLSIVVCDPWTEEYKELHPHYPLGFLSLYRAAFLLDADADMSNFRLLSVNLFRFLHNGSHAVEAQVFSADNGWSLLRRAATGDLILGANKIEGLVFVGRAENWLCWSTKGNNNGVLRLDLSTGEFSSFTLPRLANIDRSLSRRNLRVVGMDAGDLRLVRIAWDDLEVLRYVRGSGACVVERRVGLTQLAGLEARRDRCWSFYETAEVAGSVHFGLWPSDEYMWIFTVNNANIKVECKQGRNHYANRVFPYQLPWPRAIKLVTTAASIGNQAKANDQPQTSEGLSQDGTRVNKRARK